MAKVEIDIKGPRQTKVLVDGIEIPDVTGIGLVSKPGDVSRVTLEVFATEVTIDTEAAMEIVTQVLDSSGLKAVPNEG